MLEGIEVLNEIEIKTNSVLLIVLMITFLILGVTLVIISLAKDSFLMSILGLVSFIIFAIFVVLVVCVEVPTGEYQYQVTIDENVSMTEFFEKYEIIDTQGKIYTIKEK